MKYIMIRTIVIIKNQLKKDKKMQNYFYKHLNKMKENINNLYKA